MRTLKLLSIAASIMLFVVACNNSTTTNQTVNTTNAANTTANTNTAQATPTPADPMTSARAIYAAECARCHGINGDGGTVTVLKKQIKVPSLRKGHALDHTDEQMVKIITNGEEAMPSFKDKLKPEEINWMVQLIRKEFQAGAAKK
ncbi:MAG: cytochrome c [Pyrinomonadaceae bacterium]|nr:cytochrome c [Pyrinomonadaceae bacterium]